MSAALRPPPMTLAEFLAWEERQPTKWEFDGFAPVAMTGGTSAHSSIAVNLAAALRPRLGRGPCRFFNSDMKLLTARGTSRYPDGMVVCSPVRLDATSVADPVVVFEVLSPSTAGEDHGEKMREYRDTPSVRRYVILESDRVGATVFARGEGGAWVGAVLDAGDSLGMPEIGVEVPLAELYEGLDLGPEAARPAPGEPPR